jgi:hypothetical protein
MSVLGGRKSAKELELKKRVKPQKMVVPPLCNDSNIREGIITPLTMSKLSCSHSLHRYCDQTL